MNNYVSVNIPKRSLKKIGRKITLEQIENHDNLSKYLIINKYLYITSMNKINKEEYKLYDAELCESKNEIMYNKIKNILPKENESNTFAINVNRKGEHKFTSTELARDLAGAVFDVYPDISVDLDNPKLIVHVKVLNNKCLIYTEQR
tara:strand:+ start:946 stop:1386 length:441 start_codon:yes stop_codon:yes gene_type:complete